MRILLIEDEAALARPLCEHLEADHHLGEWFTTLDEVKARIHTACRRSADQTTQTIMVRDLSICFSDRSVTQDGHAIRLTIKEWSVFEVLLRRKAKIVPKASLEAAVYTLGDEVESNALEAHISRLRAKLGKDLIVSHRGIGYRLNP